VAVATVDDSGDDEGDHRGGDGGGDAGDAVRVVAPKVLGFRDSRCR
jgi:hypothetical protein